jgi:hypothetical protein
MIMIDISDDTTVIRRCEVARTCRERRPDGTRESRVREICMPGLTDAEIKSVVRRRRWSDAEKGADRCRGDCTKCGDRRRGPAA